MAEPLTIRYNNPGAIEYKPFLAKYGATVGPNGRYAQFPDVASGYSAMEGLLNTYQTKNGLNTVEGIVNRWAPPNVDNNSTSTYSMKVAQRLGVDPKAPLDPAMTPKLAEAMAAYEAGRPVPRDAQSSPTSPTPQGAPAPMAAPALTPYDGPSPDDVAMQRKLAMSLMQQGTSTEPVGHWTQALARVLQGGVGGMYQDTAREGEKQGRASIASSLSGNPNPATMATNPWLGDLGVQMYKQQAAVQPLIIPADAKAIVPDRANPGQYKDLAVGQPKLTTDENNYKAYVAETTKAGGQPMSFMDYQIKLKQAGATAITNDMRGENAETKGIGEGAAKRANATIDSARAASTTLRRMNDLQARLEAVQNGKLEPGKATVGAWAKAFGMSDSQLASLGIDPKLPGSAQSIQALSNRMVVDMIGAGGFPANNFSDADREFLEKTIPNLSNEPRANRLILEAGKRMAQLDIEKGQAFNQWRRDPANKGKSADDFELAFADTISTRDIMGDLRKEAQSLIASPDAPAAQRNLPRISAPEQVRKLPKGTKFIDPQGNVRVVP